MGGSGRLASVQFLIAAVWAVERSVPGCEASTPPLDLKFQSNASMISMLGPRGGSAGASLSAKR